MRILIENGSVYDNARRGFFPLDILIDGEAISKIAPAGEINAECDVRIDASGKRLTAGLIDVHTHGIAGYDFLLADEDALGRMSSAYLSRGVTTVMPTLASARLSDIYSAVSRIKSFEGEGARLCGIHLEGRYLSPQKKGAHAEELLARFCESELDFFADSEISPLHISAAYELDENFTFAKKALELGATLGLAHTSANYAQAIACERAGISSYTHLFNAMNSLHHRDGGPVCACLTGACYAELICDGVHISPEVVALTYKLKGERLTLISDSMEATLCPDGEYSIAGNSVSVEGGVARTYDGSLAGSTLTLDRALENLMSFCDIPLEEAIISATEAPAREIGIFDECGSIDVGKRADILLINGDSFIIEGVICGGRVIDF